MSVAGSISVAVDFNDTASDEGLEVLKKIRLASNDAYTAGKSVVLSGTCDTTAVLIDIFSPGYTAADGQEVTFSEATDIKRIAFSAEPAANMSSTGLLGLQLSSRDSSVSISSMPMGIYPLSGGELEVKTAGSFGQNPTAEYVVVIYGT